MREQDSALVAQRLVDDLAFLVADRLPGRFGETCGSLHGPRAQPQ
jgi:hypothetical protein